MTYNYVEQCMCVYTDDVSVQSQFVFYMIIMQCCFSTAIHFSFCSSFRVVRLVLVQCRNIVLVLV